MGPGPRIGRPPPGLRVAASAPGSRAAACRPLSTPSLRRSSRKRTVDQERERVRSYDLSELVAERIQSGHEVAGAQPGGLLIADRADLAGYGQRVAVAQRPHVLLHSLGGEGG